MNGRYSYNNEGTCSSRVHFSIKDGVLDAVSFDGGCPGNLLGIGSLVQDMPVEEAIRRLEGHRCGDKPTSCPDQLAKALRKAVKGIPGF